MHHSSNAANYNNIHSKFQLQLKISEKNVLLFICELSWWLGQNYAVHFPRSNGQEFQSGGKGSS